MKKYRWLFVILGVAVLGVMLVFGVALGAGITYFFLQADPVQAALSSPVEVSNETGLLISAVEFGSAADEAGLVRGDIVLEVNGEPVNSLMELQAVLAEADPGESVTLTVLHGDETRSLKAELGDRDGLAYLGVSSCGGPVAGTRMFGGSPGDITTRVIGMGAEITEVVVGSPAEEAGLQVGDVIISVDGEQVGPESGLADLIQAHDPGDSVTLEVQSIGAEESREVVATLGEKPDDPEQAYLGIAYQAGQPDFNFEGGEFPFMEMLPEEFQGQDGMPKFFFHHGEGFQGEEGMPHFFDLGELPEGVEGAVVISEVLEDTPAAEAGLQPGDLIIAVDGSPVEEIEAFVESMGSHKPGDEVSLTIIREGEEEQVQVTLAAHPDNPEKGYLGVMAGSLKIMKDMELPEGYDQNFEFEIPGVPGGDA